MLFDKQCKSYNQKTAYLGKIESLNFIMKWNCGIWHLLRVIKTWSEYSPPLVFTARAVRQISSLPKKDYPSSPPVRKRLATGKPLPGMQDSSSFLLTIRILSTLAQQKSWPSSFGRSGRHCVTRTAFRVCKRVKLCVNNRFRDVFRCGRYLTDCTQTINGLQSFHPMKRWMCSRGMWLNSRHGSRHQSIKTIERGYAHLLLDGWTMPSRFHARCFKITASSFSFANSPAYKKFRLMFFAFIYIF